MDNYWRESAVLKAKSPDAKQPAHDSQPHLIPVRMPIEIMVPIVGMMPPVIASVPVIGARIFAINPDCYSASGVNRLDGTTRRTEQNH